VTSRTDATGAPGGHLPALDGVRGLAILAVLLFHFAGEVHPVGPLERVLVRVLGYGSLGVDLFFALSGFLITDILVATHASPGYFRSFYMRRSLRIFPLYYAVLAFVFFVLPLLPFLRGTDLGSLDRFQGWAWLYGVNVFLAIHGDWVMSYLTHFWSLAVEEHFYLFWPFLVWWLAPRPRRLMQAALALAAASFASRIAAAALGVNPVALAVLTPFQLDALCLGGFFAVWRREAGGLGPIRRILPAFFAIPAIALVALSLVSRLAGGLAIAVPLRSGLLRLLLVALLLRALTAPAASLDGRFFRARVMGFLGTYSYGLYVYHHFLSYYFKTHDVLTPLAARVGSHPLALLLLTTASIAATIAVAWLSYELFERHFLKLKRFFPATGVSARPLVPGTSSVPGS
jgi:peptidoglycan/LPS O-acetylase OafA/YrhL